jgi:hypothetical protein
MVQLTFPAQTTLHKVGYVDFTLRQKESFFSELTIFAKKLMIDWSL